MIEKKACGIIPVLQKDGEDHFLLVHQVNDLWAFPKGHKEDGETDLETALRELSEETGIENVDILSQNAVAQSYYANDRGPEYHKTVVYFVGEVFDEAVVAEESEIIDHVWLSYEKALKRLSFDNTRDTLKKAKEILETLRAS